MSIEVDRHPEVVRACVALGSNLGDRGEHIAFGVHAITCEPGVTVLHVSTVRTYAPVGPQDQGAYLNAAVVLDTTLTARELLEAMHTIERDRGRDRANERRWGPRTLDLDLLLYGEAIIDEPGLTVPHPRMTERRFVLEPLAEVAPDVSIPGVGLTVSEALARLADGS